VTSRIRDRADVAATALLLIIRECPDDDLLRAQIVDVLGDEFRDIVREVVGDVFASSDSDRPLPPPLNASTARRRSVARTRRTYVIRKEKTR
jgi:hypothetical protein